MYIVIHMLVLTIGIPNYSMLLLAEDRTGPWQNLIYRHYGRAWLGFLNIKHAFQEVVPKKYRVFDSSLFAWIYVNLKKRRRKK